MEHERGHLLIIGEDKIDNFSFSDYLRETGYAVSVIKSGQQALQKLQTTTCDLALLNVTLPDMEGFHVLEQIKSDGILDHIPVLMISKTEEIAAAEKCVENGAEDILYAPFSLVLVRKRIENCLSGKRLQEKFSLWQQEYTIAQKLARDLTGIILPIGIALSKIRNFERLLEKILKETKAVCNADGGTLYLREGDELKFAIMLNDSLDIAIRRDDDEKLFPPPLKLYDELTGEPNHSNVATSSALLGIPINVPNIYQIKNYDFSGTKAFDQKYDYYSTASLTIPLKDHNGEVFGVLQLINPQDPKTGKIIPFDAYMQQVAEALASLVSLVLSYRLLLERQKELMRFEDELNIGRQIQTSFLPEAIPQPPGWEIAARLRSAREVSGDFYDVFTLDEKSKVYIVIADVCDKGVGAALFMVLIRTLIRAFAEYSMNGPTPLWSVIEFTNDYILQNHYKTNMFATLFIGLLNPASGTLTYVNNGHPAPVLINADGIKSHLLPTGPVIGAFPDITFEVRQVTLEPEDILFAFTDGITEARDPDARFFTRQHLLELLDQPASSAGELLDFIEEHVQNHIAGAAQFDDATMIAIRRKPGMLATEITD